ncbi:MAG: universal stress protein [Myxococcota bacterium]
METLRSIVVGVDLAADGSTSVGSRRAIDQACWLAERNGARITLLHSSAPDEAWSAADGGYVDTPAPSDAPAALAALAADTVPTGLEVDVASEEAPAWRAITQHVLRHGGDLVIAGKRTRSIANAPLLGSVTAKLLRKCPCPVWVVKPDASTGLRRILAATDLSAVGDRVIALAASLADLADAEFHVVHALQRPLSVQMEGDAVSEQWARDERTKAIEQIHGALEGSRSAASAMLHVGVTSPSRAVLDGFAHLSPDLVVMGTVSRGGVPGLLVGNTAERLLPRLDGSLLTVKPADFVCPVPASP